MPVYMCVSKSNTHPYTPCHTILCLYMYMYLRYVLYFAVLHMGTATFPYNSFVLVQQLVEFLLVPGDQSLSGGFWLCLKCGTNKARLGG